MTENILGTCPCGLCSETVTVKKTQPKKGGGRPYYKCNDCGFTAFCNMQESITMIMGKLKKIKAQPEQEQPKQEQVLPANDEVIPKADKQNGWFL